MEQVDRSKSKYNIKLKTSKSHIKSCAADQPNNIITTKDDRFKEYKNFILEADTMIDRDPCCESFTLTDILKIKRFILNIKSYALNSPLDEEHYKYFCKTIINDKGIYFLDRVSLVQYNDYKDKESRNLIEIINGHHRVEGLRRFFSQIPELELDKYDICLRIDVYMLDSPESMRTLSLFRNFNRVRPQKTDWNDKDITMLIITKLNELFNNDKFMFIKDSDIRVNKPSIFKKEFSSKLEKHLEQQRRTLPSNAQSNIIGNEDSIINADKIIQKFKNYNDSLKQESLEWFNSDLQKTIVDGFIKDNAYKKATKYGCFLGFIKLEHLISLCVSL
jgi:hypothetical protein